MKDRARTVVHRYLSAAKVMSPEKLTALLLKIRKGATASIKLAHWAEVLTQLGGWKVDPTVGLMQLHDESDSIELAADQDQAERIRSRFLQDSVHVLPTHPEEDRIYYMDVGEPSSGWGFNKNMWGFRYKSWRGVKGVKFVSPEGKEFDLLPSRYRKDLDTTSLEKWFRKDTKLLEQVSNRLGLPTYEAERAEKSAPRSRNGTGTCGACFRNIKLKMKSDPQLPEIVLHGYERPGWGTIHGRCLGCGYPPFELSCEATKEAVKILGQQLKGNQEYLHKLTSGEIQQLNLSSDPRRSIWITSDQFGWEGHLKSKISEVDRIVKGLEKDIQTLHKLIQGWTLQPLPVEGQKAAPIPIGLK